MWDSAMYSTSDEYLDLIAKNNCSILFEKAAPSGRLKREVITLTAHDGRHLSLSTPQGFSACPFEIPRAIFDEFLAAKLIEPDGPEGPGGRILFRLTQAGYSRADLERAKEAMAASLSTYSDFSP
jgi:hypothetical protein